MRRANFLAKLGGVEDTVTLEIDGEEVRAVPEDDTVRELHTQLKEINEALWEIEDDIRDKERAKEFDQRFIELARSVYFTNDRRSEVKKKLNLHLGSQIIEEKSYQDYA